MSEANNAISAKKVFDTICTALDNRSWNYDKDEEKLTVNFGVSGDDLPMKFLMLIEAERSLLRIVSLLPFSVPEDKRIEGALMTCVANYGMANGRFDFDFSDGSIMFKLAQPYEDCQVGTGLVEYMIDCSCATVDKYNDRFLAVSKGYIGIDEFLKQES